jgi:hypothetical protein
MAVMYNNLYTAAMRLSCVDCGKRDRSVPLAVEYRRREMVSRRRIILIKMEV